MNLTTTYMGLALKNPVVPSASPLSNQIDTVKQMEDMGAAAIVMYSLFEEQINGEQSRIDRFLTTFNDSYSEAQSYFPEPDDFPNRRADDYLEQIRALKNAVEIPIIASLNGISPGVWMDYANKIEEAGADGIELNIHYIPTDPAIPAEGIEKLYIADLKNVKSRVSIPVAMKLCPHFSALPNLAMKLEKAGADALVLFDRFYQPDIDIETLQMVPTLQLSSSYEIRFPLQWLSILYETVGCSLAASSGVHTAPDVLKLIMAGADVTMIASVLIKEGPAVIAKILEEIQEWMDIHGLDSLSEIKGKISFQSVTEPAALVRANYVKTLQSYK